MKKNLRKQYFGISSASYLKCKENKSNVGILKSEEIDMNINKAKEIVADICFKERRLGSKIDYTEFRDIYAKYVEFCKNNNMPVLCERQFAENVLGIKKTSYVRCRYYKKQVVVRDGALTKKALEVKQLYFTEPKYYSYKYIKSICEKYDMSLQDFLMYVVQNAFYDTTPYENVLSQKKKIWIGQAPLSPKFSEDNIQLIYDVSKRDCN